jgi:hypothetical protein
MELEMTALADKVAIVTGATARLLASEGARVVVTARRQAELDALVASIEEDGGHAVAVAGDIRDETLAKALVEIAVGRFGGLDVAFKNAGLIGEMKPVPDLSLSEWRDTPRYQPDERFSRRQVSGAGYDRPRRRLSRLHFHLCRPHCRDARHGGLCGEQGGVDRAGPGPRRRFRREAYL